MAKRREDRFRELVDVPGSDGSLPIPRPAALRLIGEVVYAIRVGEVIKIGHTNNLAARCNRLQADEVLAFVPGTVADKKALHQRLSVDLHHAREWYYPTPAVLSVVNEMREQLGLGPVA